jgi:hypothetical protein
MEKEGVEEEDGEVLAQNKLAINQVTNPVPGNSALNAPSDDGCLRREEGSLRVDLTKVTPTSGLNLISGGANSMTSGSSHHYNEEEKEKMVEAAKLLSIQKEVGFTFEDATNDTLKLLIDQEKIDRTKKMEWEQKEGDQ